MKRTPVTSSPSTAVVPADLSAKVRRAIDSIRPPFRAFVAQFSDLTQSRADLAPSFMKAFGHFQFETGQSFVDFVRVLDPTIGPSRADYRQHKAYQAADNLRRLAAAQSRPKSATSTGNSSVTPSTPLDGMARLIASILPLISADQVPTLWDAVLREMHWTARQVASLQNRASHTDALIAVRPPKGAGGVIPQLRIAPVARHDADEEQTAPRTGTHG